MQFSIQLEFIALILLLILTLYTYKKNWFGSLNKRMFAGCLFLSLLSILLNLASVWSLNHSASVSDWLILLLNTLYYLQTTLLSAFTAFYFFYLLFEHSPGHRCLKIAGGVFCLLYLIVVIACIANLTTGCLFTVHGGIYARGWLNPLGYVVLLIEVTMFIICYVRHHELVSSSMIRAARALPPLILLLIFCQFQDRNQLMNGILSAFIDLVLFVNFQSSQIEQDTLTGLDNRKTFYTELERRNKKNQDFRIIVLALREFGLVNRRFGHQNGDEFIYKVAKYLQNAAYPNRTYYLGNVEFAILCRGLDAASAERLAAVIRARFEEPWKISGMETLLKISGGVFCSECGRWNTDQIMERLEYILRESKDPERSPYIIFNEHYNWSLERINFLQELLKRSIAEERFEVFYQPLYCVRPGKFCSAEALIRLRDYDGNPISPSEFIPLAEEKGLIGSISWIVLDKVCQFLSQHPDLPLYSVSINMSMQQFSNGALESRIYEYLNKYQVPANKIKIEITERVISDNYLRSKRIMNQLIDHGVQFYLDDFGIGYSNLQTLTVLPFEAVKLDSGLTESILENTKQRNMVRHLTSMFHASGTVVVAEGVESAEMAAQLAELGVDRIQGYYYSKPMREQEFLEFLQKVSN